MHTQYRWINLVLGVVLGGLSVAAHAQSRCNLLLTSTASRTFWSQQSLETKAWLHHERPLLLAEFLGKKPALAMMPLQALVHQIIPDRAQLLIYSNVHEVLNSVPELTNRIKEVVDERPYKDLPFTQRLDGAIYDLKTVGVTGQELEAVLRSLRQALKMRAPLAVKIPVSARDPILRLMKKIRLELVREVAFESQDSGYLILVGERMAAPLTRGEVPMVANSTRRDPEVLHAQREGRKKRGPYFRRTDGFDIQGELLRRLELDKPGTEALDPTILDGELSVVIPTTSAAATYKPALQTVVVHHKDGEVPAWAKFIAISLHGAGSDVSNAISWRQNVPDFQALGGAMIAPDLPGASLAPDYVAGAGGRDHFVDFIARVADYYQTKYGLPIVLVGRSFGATMAREVMEDYPGLAAASFLGSFSNPYTFEAQLENVLEQERLGLFSVYWPSMTGATEIGKAIRERLIAEEKRYQSIRAGETKPRVFYIQGRQDEDGGLTVVEDLAAYVRKHDADAQVLLFDCDHFVFNSRNPEVMRLVFPFMQERLRNLGILSP